MLAVAHEKKPDCGTRRNSNAEALQASKEASKEAPSVDSSLDPQTERRRGPTMVDRAPVIRVARLPEAIALPPRCRFLQTAH